MDTMGEPQPPAAGDRARGARWIWPATLVALALIGFATTWLVLDRMERAARAVAEAPARAVDSAGRALRGFLRGDVTERFLSSIPTVTAPAAGLLEVAVAENVETISRTDERWAFWDLLPLEHDAIHGQYSGAEVFVKLATKDPAPAENLTQIPLPGELFYFFDPGENVTSRGISP